MTVFYEVGGFWFERLITTISLTDAAGAPASSLINLTKGGHFCAGWVTPRTSQSSAQTNIQACGNLALTDGAFGNLTFGEFITGVRIVQHKQAGTSGTIANSYEITLCMRN